jgi:hypothetical protein
MKQIPDFSRHKPTPASADASHPQQGGKPAPKQGGGKHPPTPRNTAKPPATHVKSGRRGQ